VRRNREAHRCRMSFAATLEYLDRLDPPQQVECLVAALLEKDAVVQGGAVQRLLAMDPKRHDLVVDHFPNLLPAVRKQLEPHRQDLLATARDKIVSGRDARRIGAFQLADALGDLGAAELLAVGVDDPVDEVAAVAIEGVATRLASYAIARRQALLEGNKTSGARDTRQEAAWQALGTALRRCPLARCRELCGVLFDLGPVVLSLFRSVLMTQPESGMSQTFVQALGHGPGEGAAAFVVALATDLDHRVQRIGQQVLRDRRDPAFAKAVAAEVAALRDERAVQQARTPRELPWWGPVQHVATEVDTRSATRLVVLLRDAKVNPDKRQEMLEPFLLHPDPNVQITVVDAIRELKCSGGFVALGKLLASGSTGTGVRAAAQLVIDAAPPQRIALLTPLLGSIDPELRRLAVREVSKVSFQHYLERFDSMSKNQREAAAKALAKIDGGMLDRIADEIGSFDPSRRLKALHIVELLDAGAELRGPLLELLDDPDKRVRATAVRIVEVTGSREGVQVLLGALADPDRRVRANAVEAFEELADPRYVQMLVPFLDDHDNRVRANAVKALWHLGWPRAREALLGLMVAPEEATRLSAIWALGEIDLPDARALLLARDPAEPSPRVRAKIHELLAGTLGREVRT